MPRTKKTPEPTELVLNINEAAVADKAINYLYVALAEVQQSEALTDLGRLKVLQVLSASINNEGEFVSYIRADNRQPVVYDSLSRAIAADRQDLAEDLLAGDEFDGPTLAARLGLTKSALGNMLARGRARRQRILTAAATERAAG